MQDRLLTIREIADRLGYKSTRSVRRLLKQDRLPYIRLGTSKNSPIRIKGEELQKFIEGGRV